MSNERLNLILGVAFIALVVLAAVDLAARLLGL